MYKYLSSLALTALIAFPAMAQEPSQDKESYLMRSVKISVLAPIAAALVSGGFAMMYACKNDQSVYYPGVCFIGTGMATAGIGFGAWAAGKFFKNPSVIKAGKVLAALGLGMTSSGIYFQEGMLRNGPREEAGPALAVFGSTLTTAVTVPTVCGVYGPEEASTSEISA